MQHTLLGPPPPQQQRTRHAPACAASIKRGTRCAENTQQRRPRPEVGTGGGSNARGRGRGAGEGRKKCVLLLAGLSCRDVYSHQTNMKYNNHFLVDQGPQAEKQIYGACNLNDKSTPSLCCCKVSAAFTSQDSVFCSATPARRGSVTEVLVELRRAQPLIKTPTTKPLVAQTENRPPSTSDVVLPLVVVGEIETRRVCKASAGCLSEVCRLGVPRGVRPPPVPLDVLHPGEDNPHSMSCRW